MRRSASEIINELEMRIATLEKQSGVMDFLFGKKEVRVLKTLSKHIVSKFHRARLEDLNLNIDSKGLIKGSFAIKGVYYNVSSKVNEKGSSPTLAITFETEESSRSSRSFKYTDQIFIQDSDPLKPTFKPNLAGVEGLVNRVLSRLVRHQRSPKRV